MPSINTTLRVMSSCSLSRISESIRTRDKKGEFQITAFVTGQIGSDRRERRSSKDFKIKEKHLQDLGWN